MGTLCTSRTQISISFPRLQKSSVHMSSNMLSAPFYLCSPSVTSIVWILVCLMLSQMSLRLSSFLKIISFSFQLGWFPLLSSSSQFLSSLSFNLLLIHSRIFFYFSYYIPQLFWFLVFSNSVKLLTVFINFFPNSLNTFMIITLHSISVNCIA